MRADRFMILTVVFTFLAATAAAGQNRPALSDSNLIGSRDINQGDLNFFSLAKETALGQRIAAEVEPQMTILDDAIVGEYVNRIGRTLALNSDAHNIPISIRVVNSAEPNAFSLPGGFIYVNAGIIMEAEQEAELAAVIAHQIAHIAARHGSELATKAQLVSLTLMPSVLKMAYQPGNGNDVPASFFNLSRRSVAEADGLAVQYLYKSGYDPRAAIRFLERPRVRDAASTSATHPSTADRIRATQEVIESVLPPFQQTTASTPEFESVKSRIGNRTR